MIAVRNPHLDLREARYNEGLSQEMLALRAGIGRDTVRRAEAGLDVTPRVQRAIAKALGMDRAELWPREKLPRPRRMTADELAERRARRAEKEAA